MKISNVTNIFELLVRQKLFEAILHLYIFPIFMHILWQQNLLII